MRLYSGTSTDFIDDSVHNRIADKLKDAYFVTYRRQASPSEVNSWRNSLRAVSQVFENARLNDHGVLLEYELPLTSKRLDCLITGRKMARRLAERRACAGGSVCRLFPIIHDVLLFHEYVSPIGEPDVRGGHRYLRRGLLPPAKPRPYPQRDQCRPA